MAFPAIITEAELDALIEEILETIPGYENEAFDELPHTIIPHDEFFLHTFNQVPLDPSHDEDFNDFGKLYNEAAEDVTCEAMFVDEYDGHIESDQEKDHNNVIIADGHLSGGECNEVEEDECEAMYENALHLLRECASQLDSDPKYIPIDVNHCDGGYYEGGPYGVVFDLPTTLNLDIFSESEDEPDVNCNLNDIKSFQYTDMEANSEEVSESEDEPDVNCNLNDIKSFQFTDMEANSEEVSE